MSCRMAARRRDGGSVVVGGDGTGFKKVRHFRVWTRHVDARCGEQSKAKAQFNRSRRGRHDP